MVHFLAGVEPGVCDWLGVAAEMLSAWLDNGLRMVYGRGVELNG